MKKNERTMEDVNAKSDGNVTEPMTLPKSTHTLLFSEPMCSFPFVFDMVIALVCLSCLGLALVNTICGQHTSECHRVSTRITVPCNTNCNNDGIGNTHGIDATPEHIIAIISSKMNNQQFLYSIRSIGNSAYITWISIPY